MDTTQLLKGVLDAAVLAAIEHEDGYGYDVVRRLRTAGLDQIGDASVYGTLRRLYTAGALSSYVVPSDGGPHRKYYGINDRGRILLDQQRTEWTAFSDTLTALLAADGPRLSAVNPGAASTATTRTRPAAGSAAARSIGEKS